MPDPILLRGCRFVLCSVDRVLERVDVYVEDGVIACLGEGCGSKTGIVIDCGGLIAMPCLYNAHTHAAMTVFRGYYDDGDLFDWLSRVWAVERKLTPRVVYLASRLAVMEMLSSGVCGFMDMYYYPEETLRACLEHGIRARLGPPLFEADRVEAVLQGFASKLPKDGLVGLAVNVHSVYALDTEVVEAASEASRRLGAPLHIHVSETRREVYMVRRRYGLFPVELLDRLGALHEYTVLVHAGWIASWELDLVARAGSSIVHCPASNMKLATAGHFPVYEAMKKGINVALGTDGPATNNTLDMLREMRVMVLLQRHAYWDTRIKAEHALQAATVGSARAMRIPHVGKLEQGWRADIVLLDARSLGMQPLRRENLVSAIVYTGHAGMVRYTIVDGRLAYSPEHHEKWATEAEKIAEELNEFIAKARTEARAASLPKPGE